MAGSVGFRFAGETKRVATADEQHTNSKEAGGGGVSVVGVLILSCELKRIITLLLPNHTAILKLHRVISISSSSSFVYRLDHQLSSALFFNPSTASSSKFGVGELDHKSSRPPPIGTDQRRLDCAEHDDRSLQWSAVCLLPPSSPPPPSTTICFIQSPPYRSCPNSNHATPPSPAARGEPTKEAQDRTAEFMTTSTRIHDTTLVSRTVKHGEVKNNQFRYLGRLDS